MKEKLDCWMRNNVPASNLIYKDGLTDQCHFVINLMEKLFLNVASDYDSELDYDKRLKIIENFVPSVIGVHRSKSVLLPVMEIDLPKIGLKVVLRCNFYDWCLSVESQKDIECDFKRWVYFPYEEENYEENFDNFLKQYHTPEQMKKIKVRIKENEKLTIYWLKKLKQAVKRLKQK